MWLDAPPLGNLALDFLHTLRRSRSGTVDLVRTPETMAAWLLTHAGAAAARLHEPMRPPDGRLLLDEAQRLRRDIGALVASYAGTGTLDPGAALGVNRILESCRRSTVLVTEGGRPALVERTHGGSLVALGPIAEAAARLVCTVEPGRIRSCAADSCNAWFVDTSRGGRRRWCSMATCGNREKVSTYRSQRSRTSA